MTTLAARRLNFVAQPGDFLPTYRVALDGTTGTWAMTVYWLPMPRAVPQPEDEVTGAWFLDMSTTDDVPIVRGAPMRDRTDVLLGVSSARRPPGAIVPYDPKPYPAREFTLGAWTTMGVLLLYLPGGFNPADFAAY